MVDITRSCGEADTHASPEYPSPPGPTFGRASAGTRASLICPRGVTTTITRHPGDVKLVWVVCVGLRRGLLRGLRRSPRGMLGELLSDTHMWPSQIEPSAAVGIAACC